MDFHVRFEFKDTGISGSMDIGCENAITAAENTLGQGKEGLVFVKPKDKEILFYIVLNGEINFIERLGHSWDQIPHAVEIADKK